MIFKITKVNGQEQELVYAVYVGHADIIGTTQYALVCTLHTVTSYLAQNT